MTDKLREAVKIFDVGKPPEKTEAHTEVHIETEKRNNAKVEYAVVSQPSYSETQDKLNGAINILAPGHMIWNMRRERRTRQAISER